MNPASANRPIRLVIVAIPAHNEAARIEACLSSIDEAARRWPGPVLTVVGADACTDATGAIVDTYVPRAMSLSIVRGRWRRASPTRRAAVAHALASPAVGAVDDGIWIANTDADCRVATDWLTRQLDEAERGVDVLTGVVTLDPRDAASGLQAAFAAHYQRRPGEPAHVHAANLGIRASAYTSIGGWRSSTSVGEEHHLMRAAARRGLRVAHADDLVVLTSARTVGRVPGGFASVLRRLQHAEPIAESA